MEESTTTSYITELSDQELAKLLESVKAAQRSRRKAALLAQECYCDRYMCRRCHAFHDL